MTTRRQDLFGRLLLFVAGILTGAEAMVFVHWLATGREW